jgi:hypothetical protein
MGCESRDPKRCSRYYVGSSARHLAIVYSTAGSSPQTTQLINLINEVEDCYHVESVSSLFSIVIEDWCAGWCCGAGRTVAVAASMAGANIKIKHYTL